MTWLAFKELVPILVVIVSGQVCFAFSTEQMSSNNRIFVGGLSNQCTEQLLEQSFAQYGRVTDISIKGGADNGIDDSEEKKKKKKRKPFAFVTFESTQSALDAISNASHQNLFKHVENSNRIDPSKRTRSNASRAKEKSYRDQILQMSKQTNLLLQVQSTHADRLVEYIGEVIPSESDYEDLEFQVEGVAAAVTRNMSLLFLSTSNPTELALRLSRDAILFRAVKKHYIVNKGALEGDLKFDATSDAAVNHALKQIPKSSTSMASDRKFRVHAFPPSKRSFILSAIERHNDSNAACIGEEVSAPYTHSIHLDPRNFTDILSGVQVYDYSGRGSETEENGLFMSGVGPAFVTDNDDATDDDAVNRAFYKLKEAMGRFIREHKDFDASSYFKDAIAIDCGSSPGGWSKFLADDMKCNTVYSVDPGELVIDLENVHHMKMKIQDAIPILFEKGAKINVFVSDMCLHEVEDQLEFLLQAKREGILDDEAFFVLTLKCNSGYSKASFDAQVAKVLSILPSKAPTRKLSTYHLFSNRNGERTVMGFIL